MNKIEKLEKQIEIHSNTIDKLNRNVQNFTLRKKSCQGLSEIVRSFAITNKEERNQSYLSALSAFNASMHSINDMKINNYNERIDKIKNDFPNLSAAAKYNAQEHITKLTAARTTLENKNKAIEAANPDIKAMLNKLNDNTTTQAVDRAEVMFDQALSNSGQNMDNIMSNISINSARAVSPTAVEIVLNSTNVITGINDKDGDMIPDKLDSKYNVTAEVPKAEVKQNTNTTQERTTHIMLVSQDELDALIKTNAPIKVNYKQKSEDGKIPILMEKTDKPRIDHVLETMKKENRKVRK